MNLLDPNALPHGGHHDEDAKRVKRIERTQPLQAGQYWRSRGAIDEEGIDAGDVLLIQSVRWVDEAAHTVILRPHPDKFDRTLERHIKDPVSGRIRTQFISYTEHRFLIEAFLDQFEPASDHAQVRASELARVQGRITQLQQELVQTQRDPQRLAHVVAQGLQDSADKAEKGEPHKKVGHKKAPQAAPVEAAAPPSQALVAPVDPAALVSMAGASLNDVIAQGVSEERVGALRAAAERQFEIATIKANWIKAKTEEISDAIQAMTPYYEEQAAAALAMTEDTRSFVNRLLKGIESLDLYIGKGVTVETICQGASAADDVPLTFVQRRLVMEEELAVWADVDSQFDFSNDGMFVKALQQHPELIEQIFPTPRCVLVMRTLRHERDYGDQWTNAAKNRINMTVFLLVRDGQNVHRVYSAVESHLRADRLFPSHNEQKETFKGIDGDDIQFKDVYYTDQLKEHERHALHYKRFLILAAGLDHRLQLFGRFYPGPKSLHFVSLDFQERYCRFLHDDETGSMLPNALARPPLAQWLRALNGYTQSGSRLLCVWNRLMTSATAPAAFDRRGERVYEPKAACEISVASIDQGRLCVFVPVSGTTNDYRRRTFKCRVELATSDPFAFVCLDAVEPEDLHHYIHHRDTRRHHLTYIRAFKVALRHVQAERAQEADTRSRLLAALNEGGVGEPQARMDLVGQTVRAWRAAKRGAPLPSFDADGNAPREWPSLLDQMAVLAGATRYDPARIARWLTQQGLVPLRLSSTGGQRLVVYAAGSASEQDDRLEPFAWVHRIRLDAGARVDGEPRELGRQWCRMPATIAREATLHEWDAAALADWTSRVSVFATPSAKQAAFDRINACGAAMDVFNPARLGELPQLHSIAEHQRRFGQWQSARREIEHQRYVRNPLLAIPIGLTRVGRAGAPRLHVICVMARMPERLLMHLAPTEGDRSALMTAFVRPYADKQAALGRLGKPDAPLLLANTWYLASLSDSFLWGKCACLADGYFHEDLGVAFDSLEHHERLSHRLDDRLRDWMDTATTSARAEKVKASTIVWAEGLFENGQPTLDRRLGIELPADYEVLRVMEYAITDLQTSVPVGTVVDIVAPDAEALPMDRVLQLLGHQGTGVSMISHMQLVYSRQQALTHVRSRMPPDGAQPRAPVVELEKAGVDGLLVRWVVGAGGA